LPKPTIIIPDTTAPAKASLDSKLQFDFNSAKIKPFSYPLLDDWAKRIDEKSADKMTLEGYASSEGNRKYNLVLSRKRAEAVKKYWINKGVPSSKIKAVGKGITNPIAPNTTEEGREKNRRVEFIYQMN
jgi:OOP family OmpA-OmpF porin